MMGYTNNVTSNKNYSVVLLKSDITCISLFFHTSLKVSLHVVISHQHVTLVTKNENKPHELCHKYYT